MFAAADDDRFTTVASGAVLNGPVTFGGKTYGAKAHEFRKFLELPGRIPQALEIALEIHPNDVRILEALRLHGWSVVNPKAVAPDPSGFRHYIQGSGAGVLHRPGDLRQTSSGWFSDRTVRYLASGKPALVQDTGFSRHSPRRERA